MIAAIVDVLCRICGRLQRFAAGCYYRSLMARFGTGSFILQPLKIIGGRYIHIGKNVHLHRQGWLVAQAVGGVVPELRIDDGCCIGNFYHIVSTGHMHLEKNVLIADRVFITDSDHGYEDTARPVRSQALVHKHDVRIGAGAWIGEGACILSSNIGRNAVVGANAVVTEDVPDFTVVAGNPARIIKRFDPVIRKWIRC